MGYRRGSVDVRGATLEYVVEGAGTPLLVLGSSIYYPRTFSKNIRESCAVVCTDLPHFVPLRPEFRPEWISFDLYSECVEAVRADAGLGSVVVVGHSHHGNIALEYARRKPDSVSHLVLIGTPPANISTTIQGAQQYWQTHATAERKAALERRRRASAELEQVSRSASESYVTQYLTDSPLYWNDPEYDASWLWTGMSFSMDAVHAFRDLYTSYELNWADPFRDVPVLVVMGLNDFAVPHTLWTNVLPELQNVTFRLLEHSGHTPQLEQSEVFDEILLSWLKRQGAYDNKTSNAV